MRDWSAIIHAIAHSAKPAIVQSVISDMDAVFDKYEINTNLRQEHFLCQAAHESAGFTTLQEFGNAHYFSRYDSRKDLGNIHPGDGARYHGRGIFQITGRANYRNYGEALGLDLEGNPELAADGKIALEIACLYWKNHNLNHFADRDDILSITKAINGGLNGLADRKFYLSRAKNAMKAA